MDNATTRKPWHRRWWGLALIMMGVFTVIFLITDNNEVSEPTARSTEWRMRTETERVTERVTEQVTVEPTQVEAPPTPTPVPEPETSFTDGQYLVGEELPPGIYRTDGEGLTGMCYVAQLDSLGGETVDNDFGAGPRSFNFATPGTVAEFSGGCTWTLQ